MDKISKNAKKLFFFDFNLSADKKTKNENTYVINLQKRKKKVQCKLLHLLIYILDINKKVINKIKKKTDKKRSIY